MGDMGSDDVTEKKAKGKRGAKGSAFAIYFTDVAGEHVLLASGSFCLISDLEPGFEDGTFEVEKDTRTAITACVRRAMDELFVFPVSRATLERLVALKSKVSS